MPQNPLLDAWTGPFGAPPFSQINLEHFRPAFDAALAEQRREIEAIKTNPAPPSFDNTILALERSGATLDRVARVFHHLVGTASNDEIEAIQREIEPRLAREAAEIALDEALFARVDAVHSALGQSGLDAEARRLVERRWLELKRSGAGLAPDKKARVAEIAERLAALGAAFQQNVLGDERDYLLLLENEADLEGLPDSAIGAAARAAAERGERGKWAFTLSRSSVEPFLQFSARRDLREKLWRAFVNRGAGARDNAPVMTETLALRAEFARILGYSTYADYKLADTMAGKPGAALDLLNRVWTPAREAALEDAKTLQQMIAEEGGNFELMPWDWRYYAEKRRQALFDLDESEIRAHLPLDNVIAAAFDVAHRLFGLSFAEISDVDLPHPDARAWEVKNAEGQHIALFVGDFFARPDKHSGAWMSAFRDQHRLDGDVKPIVTNTLNAARGPEGEPALLSHEEARTLFHEFGHALHGMLSDVTYPYLSGTNVARDFVELPSQLYEHWLDRPEVLQKFARRPDTNEAMPAELIAKMKRARLHGQAQATVEFLASGLTDMSAHTLEQANDVDVRALEAEGLRKLGMPAAIVPRHAASHFQHIFAGDGYSAGYYSYLWSEVLDADAFEAFEQSGDIFDPELAGRLKRFVYSAGGKQDPQALYEAFRGRSPDPAALLRKRGLVS